MGQSGSPPVWSQGKAFESQTSTKVELKEVRPRVLEQLAKAGHVFSVFATLSSLVQEPKPGCERRERDHEWTLGLPPVFTLY